jgi:hypothetical protein
MFTIVSTRFNNETWFENQENRRRRNLGCFYGSPQEMSPKIDYNSPVFVLEMNNSLNKIEGIGLIKNKPEVEKYFRMYTDGNFNRYIYFGNYHITRDTLIEYNELLVDALDHILFKGYTHSKRGAGFTVVPEKLFKHEICEGLNIKKDIKNIFIYHFKERLQKCKET